MKRSFSLVLLVAACDLGGGAAPAPAGDDARVQLPVGGTNYALSTQLAAAIARIDALEASNALLRQQVDALLDLAGTNNARLAGLESTSDALHQSFQSLDATTAGLAAQLGGLQTAVSGVRTIVGWNDDADPPDTLLLVPRIDAIEGWIVRADDDFDTMDLRLNDLTRTVGGTCPEGEVGCDLFTRVGQAERGLIGIGDDFDTLDLAVNAPCGADGQGCGLAAQVTQLGIGLGQVHDDIDVLELQLQGVTSGLGQVHDDIDVLALQVQGVASGLGQVHDDIDVLDAAVAGLDRTVGGSCRADDPADCNLRGRLGVVEDDVDVLDLQVEGLAHTNSWLQWAVETLWDAVFGVPLPPPRP